MNKTQRKKVHLIIHAASSAAAGIGSGMAPLPISDSVALLPIQTAMIVALAKVFNLKLAEGAAKAMATQFMAQQAGQMITRFATGKIPIAGSIINGTTAAAITEAYGWSIVKEFSTEQN